MLHLHLREGLSCYNADVLLRMLLVWRILLKMFMLSNNCMKVGFRQGPHRRVSASFWSMQAHAWEKQTMILTLYKQACNPNSTETEHDYAQIDHFASSDVLIQKHLVCQ